MVRYALGFGAGISFRGGGDIQYLVRAVIIDGVWHGMTAFARMVAHHLGLVGLPGPRMDFHNLTGIADVTSSPLVRLEMHLRLHGRLLLCYRVTASPGQVRVAL